MAEFFLSGQHFSELYQAYIDAGPAGINEIKGIVIKLSSTTRTIVVVKGQMDSSGRIPEISSSTRKPCPYPPPCKKNEQGECLTDEQGNFILDDKDPDVNEFR